MTTRLLKFKEEIESWVEGPTDKYGPFLRIPLALFNAVRDDAFDWLADCIENASTPELCAKFLEVLRGIGYYSDGMPESFADRAYSTIANERLEWATRVAFALGALEWPIYFRPEEAIAAMRRNCRYVLFDQGPLGRDRRLSEVARHAQKFLDRRARAWADVRRGVLIVPDDLLTRKTATGTADGEHFARHGFSNSEMSALRKAIVSAMEWGVELWKDEVMPSCETRRRSFRRGECEVFEFALDVDSVRLPDNRRVVVDVRLPDLS